jgi:AbrB family looped-hinge helix DNA binding protein
MTVETSKLSKRGQIVVPQKVRKDLGLAEGDRFLVYGTGDAIVFKKMDLPSVEELERLTSWGRKFAETKRITRRKVAKAIKELREETHTSSA